MDKTHSFPQRKTGNEYLQYQPKRTGLDTGVSVRREFDVTASASMNVTDPLSGNFNEKDLLHGLNGRLAGFIDKVHQLEYQNQLLEREIEEIRGKARSVSSLEQEYGPELRRMRELVQDITHQKGQIEIEHQNMEEELSNLKRQREKEAQNRSVAESNIMVLKRDMNDAYQAKLQLDKKAQSLVDEMHFLKSNHEAEVSEMINHIQNTQEIIKAHEFGNPGVTAALRDVRAQLEGHAVSDVHQVGETFRSQFAKLTEAAEVKREALRATQQEINEYRRRLQAKNIELDCAKGTGEALEKQLHEVEDRHKEEILHYQDSIKQLENELINCKFDMSGYLREYQDLLNVKMALDVEILSYRKLLCGEEARLSAVSDTHMSLPYIYHQSPVYPLPCVNRQGGVHRWPEPQYKFVEEIITETTREIEMSEFEETGSEETEAGQDEQCTKRERGSSKEEEEEEEGDKDSGEDEGEQISDGQQDQVERDDDEAQGGGGEDGDEEGEGGKGEEELEVENNEDIGAEEDTPVKFHLTRDIDEEDQPNPEKTNQNKEAGNMETVQKDGELKEEVPVEDKQHETSEDDTKHDPLKETKSTSAPAKTSDDKVSAQEFRDSDKTQEAGGGARVEKEVHVVASETREETDLGAESKSSLLTGTENKTSMEKSEEKGNGKVEQKEMSTSEKREDKAQKRIEDQNKDRQSKAHMESDLKVEKQKLNSEEETKTVPAELPKQKSAATAEVKDTQKGAPESGQSQKSEASDKK